MLIFDALLHIEYFFFPRKTDLHANASFLLPTFCATRTLKISFALAKNLV